MSAGEALMAARAVGVVIRVDGGDLVLEASGPPPGAILDMLSKHKAAVIELLRSADDAWSAEDWRAHFDERAGVAEFEGGLSRDKAEARAFACCITEWLDRNHTSSPPDLCLGCGNGDRPRAPLLPYGGSPAGHVWLHSHCWPAWYAGRKAEAGIAVSRLPNLPDGRAD